MFRFLSIILCLASLTATAADRYIRPNSLATGSNNGTDWANAYKGFGAVTWTAGNTYWVAGGLYTNRCQPTANNIIINRVLATDSAPTNATGWSAGFDSQVVLSNSAVDALILFQSAGLSNVVINGRQTSGIIVSCPNIDNSGNGARGISWRSVYHKITLLNIEVAGPFTGTNLINLLDDTRPFDHYTSGGDGLTVSNCQFHGGSSVAFLLNCTNATFIQSAWGDSGALNSVQWHPNLFQVQDSTNIAFSRCLFYNWEVEGFMFLSGASHNFAFDNCLFLGNTNWTVSRAFEAQETTHGPVKLRNCTFANIPSYFIRNVTGGQAGQFTTDSTLINCAVFNFNPEYVGFAGGINDYNISSSAAALVPGAHSISGASTAVFNNFSRFWNANTIGDFGISTNIASAYPRNKGTDLGTSFATDYAGNTHGADGLWDIGAYEASGTAPVTAPEALRCCGP